MTREEFSKCYEEARRLVESWPEWKQNILAGLGDGTLSEPRKPVVQDD